MAEKGEVESLAREIAPYNVIKSCKTLLMS